MKLKNILILFSISKEEIENKINNTQLLKEEFKNAKTDEAIEFSEKYVKAQFFSLEASNEAIFTLNEIKKYIDFIFYFFL